MTEMLRVFVGFDHAEEVAYHTLCSSIIRRCSMPVSITPIALDHFKGFFRRKRDQKQSNSFSFSRFLVPYLCGYSGWAIFMDSDMLVKCDLAEVWRQWDDEYAVMCAQHHYTPKDTVKYLGNEQHVYPKKNWSSLMLMNCDRCKQLTPEYVATASGMDLHRFNWLGKNEVGSLPLRYNWLVGEYPKSEEARILHFTIGGPWFHEYANCDYSDEWREEFQYAIFAEQLRSRKAAQHQPGEGAAANEA